MKRRLLILAGTYLIFLLFVPLSYPQSQGAQIKEIAKKVSGGLEVTLISAPPLSQEELKKLGMDGMGMMGMPSEPATHYLGIILRDQKTQKVVPNLKITLTTKGPVARKIELMSMPGSYAQNISLPTGQYEILVRIDFPKGKRKPVEVRFQMKT